MFTELDKRTAKIADLIINEFDRLGVSANQEPYSGLMTRIPNIVTTDVVIEVYDDYASGFYDGEKVLGLLKTLSPEEVSLSSEDAHNIWQHIAEFEV